MGESYCALFSTLRRETNHRTQSRRGQFLFFSLFLKKAKYLGSVSGIYRLHVVAGSSLDTVKDTVKEINCIEGCIEAP